MGAATFEPDLFSGLSNSFDQSGEVVLESCEVGKNKSFIRRLSKAFGRPVVGYSGLFNAFSGYGFGDEVRCNNDQCN